MMEFAPTPVVVSQGFALMVYFEFLLAGWVLGYMSCMAVHARRLTRAKAAEAAELKAPEASPQRPGESDADYKARAYQERGYGWRG